ncbi:MAG TPA: hypothetical protein VK929_15605 [Longimicrobiales bacterium]|nr:hypothetical protein [Longimicrobiales bacterium]
MSGAAGRRSGASLAVALAALVLIECVIIGTLHLALLERRLVAGSADVLRLRLAAEAALAHAAATWPDAAESLPPDGRQLTVLDDISPDGVVLRASVQRIGPALYLLRSSASLPAPAHGQASAESLLLPPVLPPEFDAAEWTDPPEHLLPASRADTLLLRVLSNLPYLESGARVRTLEPGASLAEVVDGVVVAAGDLRVTASGSVAGMLFVAGTLHLEDGARLAGAVIARSFLDDGAGFDPLPEVAQQATDRAGLGLPRPAPGRARIPAF